MEALPVADENGAPAKTKDLCGGRKSQDTGVIFCLQEMEQCILCFDEASGRGR